MMAVFATLVLSFTVMFLAVLAMAAGVLAGRAPIKGSCGGVGSRGCELCSEHRDVGEESSGDGRCH